MDFTQTLDVLEEIGKYVRTTYKAKLKAGGHIASGKLYDSIGYKIKVTEKSITLEFKALKYWINIEDGRGAGKKMPPINAIKRWMVKKGITKSNSTAYLIARKIGRDGIKPSPYLHDIKKTLPSYTEELEKAIKIDVDNYMEQQLKQTI